MTENELYYNIKLEIGAKAISSDLSKFTAIGVLSRLAYEATRSPDIFMDSCIDEAATTLQETKKALGKNPAQW